MPPTQEILGDLFEIHSIRLMNLGLLEIVQGTVHLQKDLFVEGSFSSSHSVSLKSVFLVGDLSFAHKKHM